MGTLESRFYLIFTLVFFATILTMQIISTRFTITSVRSAILENSRQLTDELVEQIDSYIAGMVRISQAIMENPDVEDYLAYKNVGAEERLASRFAAYIEARDDISSVILFRPDGDAVSADGTDPSEYTNVKKASWYRNALSSEGRTMVSTAYVQNLIPGHYSWVVSLSTAVPIPGQREPGVLLVDLKFNRIKELCESLVVGEKGYDFILDAGGNYVFHPSQQLMFSEIKQEPVADVMRVYFSESPVHRTQNQSYVVARSKRTGWYVVSVLFDADLVTGWPYVHLMNALTGLVLFLIVGLVTNFISKGITRPLRRLQEVMQSVETGEFLLAGDLDATDEIRELAREYDLMVGRIGELMEANTREIELKRKSDLKALQAQINPHFLYNTLDSIIWMGEMQKSDEVVKMTSALSRLFRISISKGNEIIPLRSELEHVRSYLTIQEMRYKNKFRYLIDIPEDLQDVPVLKITLQPLVENAIYHGIRSVDYTGLIEIAGKREGNDVLLTVTDNGQGMDRAVLEKLLQITAPSESGNKAGTGVRNVHERIRLYFGEGYGLSLEEKKAHQPETKMTRITIRIPSGTEA
ncbi:MAG: sensor histidine kinase [Spirochaetales bacterium]|nr:sensor histidine kinase [Spirochaetales bacterium]